ncbi:MAG: fumarylacetoacetate hydrolase family protein [Halobacteriovoraceae bacterium]|nr:fumarylacetoacetate hydrolase family protein [Halobacteriovoraceae bacterium]
MKLATLNTDHPDGCLVVVSQDNTKMSKVKSVPTMQYLMENWQAHREELQKIYQGLNTGKIGGTNVDEKDFHSPLPRAYQFLDGSAYLRHVELVRKARGAEMPPELKEIPLMYQGLSDTFLTPTENIPLADESHGLDFEGEVGVITDEVPMGITENEAEKHIKLLILINDISLRGLIPGELKRGFGFLQGKPASSFAPLAVTPEELKDAWREGRIHLPFLSYLNGEWFGHPDAGAMHFSFGKLISHAARTRKLHAGAIIGSGTVSNENREVGSSCLAEKRMLEKIEEGKIKTPFMKAGDVVKMEMKNKKGESVFGTIEQKVVSFH